MKTYEITVISPDYINYRLAITMQEGQEASTIFRNVLSKLLNGFRAHVLEKLDNAVYYQFCDEFNKMIDAEGYEERQKEICNNCRIEVKEIPYQTNAYMLEEFAEWTDADFCEW